MTGNNPSPSDFLEAALNGAQLPANTEDTGSDLVQAALEGASIANNNVQVGLTAAEMLQLELDTRQNC